MASEPRVRSTDGRPSPEEMLDRVRRQAGAGARGRHRVYLGIAPGVGKTYTALEEPLRRKERGTDVVIGFLETHGRRKTATRSKRFGARVSRIRVCVETAANASRGSCFRLKDKPRALTWPGMARLANA